MSFSAAQKHLFYTEIAKLLEAGFGIRDAGRVMLDHRLPSRQAALLKEMEQELDAGKSIAEAFSHDASVISGMERSIIGAGERGGRMAPAFQHLADYYGMLAEARRDALTAMVYPVVMLHLGIFTPFLVKYFGSGQTAAELFTSFGFTMLVVYACCFGIWLGIRALLAAATTNPAVDSVLQRIPMIGSARKSMMMARFTKVYHTALLAGLSMRETVETAAEASRSACIKQAAATMASSLLKDGGALGPIFMASGAFPSTFARSYATAEEAGSLDKDLARWARVFQEDAARGSKMLANALPKIAYFLVLLYVAWTIVSFYGQAYSGVLDME